MTDNNVIVIRFADAKVPEFKQSRGAKWVTFGDGGDWHNRYPEYLLHLYNKSAKHNAIVNGKVSYIIGNGFKPTIESPEVLSWASAVNGAGETLTQVFKKVAMDVELYGGGRLQIIPDKVSQKYHVYHVDFGKLRTAIDGKTFFYKNDWKNSKETPICYPMFHKGIQESSIIAYNEYRPGIDIYPLPGYLGANNYIETDIEISKYYLSAIKNGMLPSKMIQFFNGTPEDVAKKNIEGRFEKKFGGSENAGRIILVFNDKKEHEVKIDDLSSSDLDKHFQELDKTVQQNIFSGHQITNPMLFGVKESGQLGGADEIINAYDIFKNTYINDKQNNIEAFVNYVSAQLGVQTTWKIQPVDPIGFKFSDIQYLKDVAPKAFILEKIGIDPNQYPETAKPLGASVNDHVKNLTGRQMQNIERIVRKFRNGTQTRDTTVMLLKNGFGFSDEDINAMLIEEQEFSSEEDVCSEFEKVGEVRSAFNILHNSPVNFSSDNDMREYEEKFTWEGFKEELTETDKRILELLKKDGKVSPADIAKAIGETESYVNDRLKDFENRQLISSSGSGVTVSSEVDSTPKTSLQIRYSYEKKAEAKGSAIIKTTRPFCRKLINLDRMYSRAEIEMISSRVGYSVFDRAGGFWNNNGTIEDSCRHEWRANVVIKKK